MLVAAVLALPLAGCGGDDLHLLARFSPTPGQAFMVMVPFYREAQVCTSADGEHRIALSGSVIELQRLQKPDSYPGRETYVREEAVRVSANTFTEVNVGEPERITVVIAESYVVEAEARRKGGTLLTCQTVVQ
jgi:hypothetical protein